MDRNGQTVRLALKAMATRFEIVLVGEEDTYLRAAGEAALREIRTVDRRFSFYNPRSELARLNRRAATEPVRVAPDLFALLETALSLTAETEGAFDPTVGPLMRCWGFYRGTGAMPTPEALDAARAVSGASHVILDSGSGTISFDRPGVELDLGGIGKGYAIDEAVRSLRENGIRDALVHGGTSTVYGLGRSWESAPWRVAISDDKRFLGTVELSDDSLSVSAPSGKSFESKGERLGHVIDPRTGRPTRGAAVAAVTTGTATRSDALSTAALVLGAQADLLSARDPGLGIAVWARSDDEALSYSSGLPGFRRGDPRTNGGLPDLP
jgi:thiamine biosynthesis lipoprotein